MNYFINTNPFIWEEPVPLTSIWQYYHTSKFPWTIKNIWSLGPTQSQGEQCNTKNLFKIQLYVFFVSGLGPTNTGRTRLTTSDWTCWIRAASHHVNYILQLHPKQAWRPGYVQRRSAYNWGNNLPRASLLFLIAVKMCLTIKCSEVLPPDGLFIDSTATWWLTLNKYLLSIPLLEAQTCLDERWALLKVIIIINEVIMSPITPPLEVWVISQYLQVFSGSSSYWLSSLSSSRKLLWTGYDYVSACSMVML